MRTIYLIAVVGVVLAIPGGLFAQQTQQKDRAVFVAPKNEFLDSIRVVADKFKQKEKKAESAFRLDFKNISAPESTSDFTRAWSNPPVSQGFSGMCWCFSTTSFFESEIYRLTKKEVKLSELYTVYWEYVEKARRFVQERGNSAFGEGSEANAVSRIWKKYGVVPAAAYNGLLPGAKVHDHGALAQEMEEYLMSLKRTSAWNEEAALATIRSILDHYLGRPPETIQVDGKTMTPVEYLANVLRLKLDDYVEIMSLMEKPYYQKAEYEVGDNWWHSKDYLNVPLDDFMSVVRKAVRNGYTLCIGGDTSEPGYEGHAGIAVVPTFDIPAAYIDENARQFRFSNRTTGDDHGIHIVGYTVKDGVDWYLIKDSGSGSRNNSHPGYYFYREDYVKLKIMDFTVHKDMAADILKKIAAN
jgi:bleomycin hydrolase